MAGGGTIFMEVNDLVLTTLPVGRAAEHQRNMSCSHSCPAPWAVSSVPVHHTCTWHNSTASHSAWTGGRWGEWVNTYSLRLIDYARGCCNTRFKTTNTHHSEGPGQKRWTPCVVGEDVWKCIIKQAHIWKPSKHRFLYNHRVKNKKETATVKIPLYTCFLLTAWVRCLGQAAHQQTC